MQTASDPITLVERLRSIGISDSYAWQLANRKRTPSLPLALRIHRELGVKMGPVTEATTAEIRALERVAAKPATPETDHPATEDRSAA